MMFKHWGIKRGRKKHKYMFEERFKKKINLSEIKSEDSFYIDYIKEIEQEYRDIVQKQVNNGDNYLEREKIRLETTIKNLERQNYNPIFFTTIVSTLVVLSTFLAGKILDENSNGIKFAIGNVVKNTEDPKVIQELNNVLNNYLSGMSSITFEFIILLMASIVGAIISLEVINNIKNKNTDMKIAFNRMCLLVIERL